MVPTGRESESDRGMARLATVGLLWTIPALSGGWAVTIVSQSTMPFPEPWRTLLGGFGAQTATGVIWLLLVMLLGGWSWLFLGAVSPDHVARRKTRTARWAAILTVAAAGIGLIVATSTRLPVGSGVVASVIDPLRTVFPYVMAVGLSGLIVLGLTVLGGLLTRDGAPIRGVRLARTGLILGVAAGCGLLGLRILHDVYTPDLGLALHQLVRGASVFPDPPAWSVDARSVFEILAWSSLLVSACVAWASLAGLFTRIARARQS